MFYKLYVIFDKKAGLYSNPMSEVNEECAIRHFNFIVSQSASQGIEPTDCELYCIGRYNSYVGTIEANEKPLFVCGGVVNE